MTTLKKELVPGADGTEYGLGRKLPAGDRAEWWFEFGADERRSARNHARHGSRGWFSGTVAFVAGGFTGNQLNADVANDFTTGDHTIIAFFTPATTGADLSSPFVAGAITAPNSGTVETAPTRFGSLITQRVFTGAPRDVVGSVGTYDSTAPASNGTGNSITKLITTSLTETLCVILEFVASTRVITLTLRNAATFATPGTTTTTAAANHIKDNRTTLPMECGALGGSVARSFMGFSGLLTQAEKDAIYALERTRLTALGVANL